MDLKELWIGDILKVKSTGKIGTYEGKIGNDIAILKIAYKKVEVLNTDLETYSPPKEKKSTHKKVYKKPSHKIDRAVPDQIDLHLEKLTPNHLQIIPEIKLDFQVNACISYLQRAVEARKSNVTIIHGKGTGTLKAEVHNLIKDFPQIYHSHEKNDGGALEVWFRY
jgi:dsDNA-specific endonuclease/ATPase MutS2